MSENEAITNYSLHAKMMVMEGKLEAYGGQMNEHVAQATAFREKTGTSLREINASLSKGEIRFALLDQTIGQNSTKLSVIDDKLDTLIASENQRKGRDGLLSQIWNSSIVRWLAGILTLVGTFFWGRGGGGTP